MRVLIACEFSGVVREAFRRKGHDAWSCDLIETEIPGPHIQTDVLEILGQHWDLMIAFPPCTYLAVSGARWFAQRKEEQQNAIAFVRQLLAAPILQTAIENPIGVLSTALRKPDQIIQPWQFGHGEVKSTCLWLKNLSKLLPGYPVNGRAQKVLLAPQSTQRAKNRSRTFPGIAEAMADQWG